MEKISVLLSHFYLDFLHSLQQKHLHIEKIIHTTMLHSKLQKY